MQYYNQNFIKNITNSQALVNMITPRLDLLIIPFSLVLFFSSSVCEDGMSDIHIQPRPVTGPEVVHITNALGPNVDLTVHCKSKDDDLGARLLHNGDGFEFSFNLNIFGTTLFFCSFQWGNEFHRFDVSKPGGPNCRRPYPCVYNIVSGGPCLFNNYTNQYDPCFPWKMGSKRNIVNLN